MSCFHPKLFCCRFPALPVPYLFIFRLLAKVYIGALKTEKLKICSLNARGLSNPEKRRETFGWLRDKKYSVYFLQEAHSTKDTEGFWLAEWGYKGIFSSRSSSRAGVCILFNNNFFFKIKKYFSDPQGRYVIADIQTEDKVITLQNIYAPNEDEPVFFFKCI